VSKPRMTKRLLLVFVCSCLIALSSVPALAQAPPPKPPPGVAGSLGAGLALTNGNSDTSTVNVAYEVLRDHGTDIVLKSAGLYLRGANAGETNVDRAAVDGRIEYRLTPRLAAFGMTTYARDRFKEIDYLVAPTGGLSYKVIATDKTEWVTDGSLGFVVEKNTGFDAATSGAILAGEKFTHRFTETTRFLHGASGLWKMNDFDDAFYTFSAGLATSLASALELKTEFLNTYKARPTKATLKKSDQSIVVSVVYKF
jgi:putative salt-induced outer membrane protein YdiY